MSTSDSSSPFGSPIPRRTLLAGAAAGSLLATLPAAAAKAAVPTATPQVVTYAHRGSSGSVPENTLAAVDFAIAQHTDFVETDVRRTKDGQLIIMHDDQLGRTTNVEDVFPDRAPYWVHDFTLAEIKQLDAGSWFSPQFAGEKVPTFDEFVDRIGHRAGLLLEIKGALLYPGIEQDVVDDFKSRPGYLNWALSAHKLIVQSFWVPSSRAIHQLLPDVPVGILYDVKPTDADLVEASTWADHINPGNGFTDQKLIDRVHELGMQVAPYSLDTGQSMQKFLAMGVDGIITANPGMLHDIETIGR
ncbi:glycerophosphodiester phosphodiesterase [Streptomyces brasiliensis]|uniref:Hydrolase n=1 Tax=Streptomyces brasiliensis TaxID=1954 RepID=A0A917UL65_9ACTN|nr:glycerophosphodiester phosphodiesterase family protein [Streptomyces brasiliensis]GGJ65943.1 hydrolase [Streptomyces brasiliensis]